MQGLISAHVLRNYLEDVLRVKLRRTSSLRPLMFSYYVTSACNFNCAYCVYAHTGITRHPQQQLDTEGAIQLLGIIRKACPNLYITGGEPLMRKDIVEILKAAKKLRFSSVSMISNMSLMHKRMNTLDYLTNLNVSMDMADMNAYAKVVKAPAQVVAKVKENIIRCAALQKKKGYVMTINCVATKDTLPQVKQVIFFTQNTASVSQSRQSF
ncbi:MAG: radical SAM protein [Nanoarchaeota archaeon]